MMFLGATPRRDTILQMVRPRLDDKDTFVQVSALIVLRRSHDPSWRTEAQKRVDSPDEHIREMARGMLSMGEMK